MRCCGRICWEAEDNNNYYNTPWCARTLERFIKVPGALESREEIWHPKYLKLSTLCRSIVNTREIAAAAASLVTRILRLITREGADPVVQPEQELWRFCVRITGAWKITAGSTFLAHACMHADSIPTNKNKKWWNNNKKWLCYCCGSIFYASTYLLYSCVRKQISCDTALLCEIFSTTA